MGVLPVEPPLDEDDDELKSGDVPGDTIDKGIDQLVTEFEISEEEHSQVFREVGSRRLSCFPYTLQLVVCKFSKNKSVQEAITDAHSLVRSVNTSGVGTQLFISLCGKKLVSSVPTRWGSTYLMLKRLLEVRPLLPQVLDTMRKDDLPRSKWELLREMVGINSMSVPIFSVGKHTRQQTLLFQS